MRDVSLARLSPIRDTGRSSVWEGLIIPDIERNDQQLYIVEYTTVMRRRLRFCVPGTPLGYT